MMKITTGMGEDGFFIVTINTPLIEKYYQNLVGMLKGDRDCPRDITIARLSSNTVSLRFQMGEGGLRGEPVGGKIGIDETGAKPLINVLSIAKRFSFAAYKHSIRGYEFIPLSGYSIDELKKDILAALDNKRSFALIDTYSHYKDLMESPEKTYKQYLIPYDSKEYVDVFLMIRRGDLKGLSKTYKGKLKEYSWM